MHTAIFSDLYVILTLLYRYSVKKGNKTYFLINFE